MEATHALEANELRMGIGQAAEIAQVHPDTLRRAIKAGRLPYRRTPGGHFRVTLSDIEALFSPGGDAA